MLGLGVSDLITFIVIIGICLFFAILWVVISERKRMALRQELRRLHAHIDDLERETFMMQEKMTELESMPRADTAPGSGISIRDKRAFEKAIEGLSNEKTGLEDENNKLKKELIEARKSLEEVYKALGEA